MKLISLFIFTYIFHTVWSLSLKTSTLRLGRLKCHSQQDGTQSTDKSVNPMFCGVNSQPKKKRLRPVSEQTRKPVNPREWVDRDGTSSLSSPDYFPREGLKVVTYNVLGPLHGEGSKHDYAAEAITRWTRRRDRLIEEIIDLDADILCLQEVSQKALKETFIPRLLTSGLECSGFAPSKRGDQKTGKYAHKYVGCAIFTRKSKLTLVQSKRVHLRDWAPMNECKSLTLREEMKSHWNCMAMALLKVRKEHDGEEEGLESAQASQKASEKTVMVGNAHLFWNPARADVKVLQAAACTHALAKFAGEIGASPPILLCGDFNTPPALQEDFNPDTYQEYNIPAKEGAESYSGVTGRMSGAFQFLCGGSIENDHPQHPDNWCLKLGDKGIPNPQMGSLKSPLPTLHHPYLSIPEFRPYQPLFTTRTDDFSAWIDHIWCTQNVHVAAVMSPVIRAGDLEAGLKRREFRPIPSKEHPSDHLPLGVMITL